MAAMDEAVDWARGLDEVVEWIAPRFRRRLLSASGVMEHIT
jgi:hypothetical protein